ncbi:glycosyl hydrolase [Philodulcilactobacillus myokoensis]|uniref:Glycosyl hydrolase n=1 Tax=Philodulcilactobacillus myokoensis TaxID=2929573 RepID=A0A9W6B1X9_9LACO|nr:glycoside hydrolase family 3 C-terminal domain-containing protein [Philodulcilactobacillus myokoensis]GLB47447.1 glycosyl hydrolase [Philodulcilactobacillus myokoensis]
MKSKFNLDFVKRLTLKQKAELVTGHHSWYTYEIKNKGIPKVEVSDGPSGLRKSISNQTEGINQSVQAICFPSSALTACSFDTRMLFKLGQQLGIASRVENVDVLLGPGINIKRSPLSGRNFEFFSEDPYLSGELGSAYVNGVQNKGVGVSVKHFAANNRENQRFSNSSNIDERALREIYLLGFEKVVKEANPATIMCSYNKINGTLNSQNPRLLTQILRNEWGYQGLVMSDWGAVDNKPASLNAGLDLEMPGKGEYSAQLVMNAIQNGTLSESKLDLAVLHVLKLVEKYHLDAKTISSYDKGTQHEFAKKAAEDSIVLLKNDHQTLPIHKDEKIAIIGKLAEKPRYQGSGSSHVNSYQVTTPLEAAKNSGYKIQYAAGYSLDRDQTDNHLVQQAINLAKTNDRVIVFAGFPESYESEGFDKTSMALPNVQNDLIKKLAQVNHNITVVLQNGSAVEMPWRNDVSAILETYLAGEAVGDATWDILTDKVNPSGKLAETFPIRLEDNPTYGTFDVSHREENYYEGIFVGYRYYDLKHMKVNYPFGHGLSYTTFDYSKLQINQDGNRVTVDFDIKNTGNVRGKDVAQIYVSNEASSIPLPEKELKAFTKVELQPGETKHLSIKLNRRSFAWYDVQLPGWRVDNGNYTIKVGRSSRDIQLEQSVHIHLGIKPSQKITENTYVSEILNRSDLKPAIKEAGIKSQLDSIGADAAVLANIPLRATNMINIKPEQMKKFIELANK